MAITDSYVTAAEYRAITGKSDESQDSDVLLSLTAITRHLEGRLGRFFNVDANDVTRVYIVPDAGPRLSVNDLSADPTTIKIDEDHDGSFADDTALASADYELHPISAPLGPEGWPYTSIVLTDWGTKGSFGKGQRVEVVGKFGWPAVPEAVKQATAELTAILRLESARATTQITPMGDVGGILSTSRPAQDIIHRLTEQYKAHYFV